MLSHPPTKTTLHSIFLQKSLPIPSKNHPLPKLSKKSSLNPHSCTLSSTVSLQPSFTPKMSSQHSNINSRNIHSGNILCFCGVLSILQTSGTDRIPTRRFLGCPNFPNGCNFFSWVDGSLDEKTKNVVNELLKKVARLESDNEPLKKKVTSLEEMKRSKIQRY